MALPSPTSKTVENLGEPSAPAAAEGPTSKSAAGIAKSPTGLACAHCHAPLGSEPKRTPVNACDAHGGSPELWCPRCFVWVRARMEPGRYFADAMTPLSCSLCGWESLALGAPRCGQCKSTLTVALGFPLLVTP